MEWDGSPVVGCPNTWNRWHRCSRYCLVTWSGRASGAPTHWFYRDDEGHVQGPFPTSHMAAWAKGGYFNSATLVRAQGDDEFQPLETSPLGKGVSLPAPPAPGQTDSAAAVAATASPESSVEANSAPAPAEVPSVKAKQWMYIDDDGNEQGPFEEDELREWIDEGYFDENTKVKPVDAAEFVRLAESSLAQTEQKETVSDAQPSAPSLNTTAPEEEQKATALESTASAAAAKTVTAADATVPAAKSIPPASEEDEKWYYLDDNGVEQGPWSHPKMRKWFVGGFILPDVRVRTASETEFVPIAARIAQGRCSFVPPAPPPAAPAAVGAFRAGARFAAQPQHWMPANVPQHLLPMNMQPMHMQQQPPPRAQTAPLVPAPNPESFKWYYLDKQGKQQGPWSTAQMREWYKAGHLTLQIRVRTQDEPTFTAIGVRDCAFTRDPVIRKAHSHHPSASLNSVLDQVDRLAGTTGQPFAVPDVTPVLSDPGAGQPAASAEQLRESHQYTMQAAFSRKGKFLDKTGLSLAMGRGDNHDPTARFFDQDRWQEEMNMKMAKKRRKLAKA